MNGPINYFGQQKILINCIMALIICLFFGCKTTNNPSPIQGKSTDNLSATAPVSTPSSKATPKPTPLPTPTITPQPAEFQILSVESPYTSLPCTDRKGNKYYSSGSYINVVHPDGKRVRFTGLDREETLESSCKLIDAEPYQNHQNMPGVIKQYQKDGSIKYVFKSCLSTYEEGLLSQAKYGLLGRCFITETDEMFVFDHRFYIFHNIDLNTGIVRRFSGYHRNNWPDNYRNRFLKDGSKDNASFHEIRSIVHDPFHNRLVFVDNGRIRSVSLKDGSVSIIANLNEYTEHDNVSVTVNPDTGEIYGMNHHVDEAIYRIEDGKKILIFRQKPYNPYYNDNTLEKLRLNADYLYFHKKTGMLLLPADKSYSYLSPEGVTFQGPTRTPFQIFALDLHSQSDSKAIQRLVINYPDDFSNIYAAYAILVEPNGDLIVDHGSTLSRVTFPNGRMMLTDTPYDIGYDYKN